MEIEAKFKELNIDYQSGKTVISFETDLSPAKVESLVEPLKNKDTILSFKKKVKRRSKDANALMWACIQKLADVSKPPISKWDKYLELLIAYGQSTYVLCEEEALEELKKQWREVKVVGDVNINGDKKIAVLCCFGSHTYTTEEFAKLLDGIIDQMISEGLEPPMSEEIRASLEIWQQMN